MPVITLRSLTAVSCLALSTWLNAATLDSVIVDQNGKPLPYAVVSLKGGQAPAMQPIKAVMDQRKQEFVPRVLAVRTGTQVSFPNSDNIRHQVYSFSAPKRFELRLYEGTPTDPLLFDKPGVVVLGCNIHDWMLGYIYVTDDPWFVVSDASGHVRFDPLPAGHYTVTLWHPQLQDMLSQPGGDVDVPAAGLSKNFSLNVLPSAADAPSAPSPSAFGDAFGKALDETKK